MPDHAGLAAQGGGPAEEDRCNATRAQLRPLVHALPGAVRTGAAGEPDQDLNPRKVVSQGHIRSIELISVDLQVQEAVVL